VFGAKWRSKGETWRRRYATTLRQLFQFSLVGAVGFVVDAGILMLLVRYGAWHALAARCISFPAAVTATWWLNRTYVFRGRRSETIAGEYGLYVGVQAIGALINIAVFAGIVLLLPASGQFPVTVLAVASAIALIFNYSAARVCIFRQPGTQDKN